MKERGVQVSSSMVRFGNGIEAFQAEPQSNAKRPAVILLHERYGLVQHTKDVGLKFAQAGYVGFAPDLFHRFMGDKKALHRGEARCRLRDDEVIEDLGAAVDYLKGLGSVDSSRIAVMGVCATGRHSLLLCAETKDVSPCVIFYGAVGGNAWDTDEFRRTPVESLVQNLSCSLLGVFGEADHGISVDDVLKFRSCLEKYKKSYYIRIYPDAPHGWLNDTMPGRYREDAATHAWRLLLSFLEEQMGNGENRDRVIWDFDSNCSTGYDFKKNVRFE